MKNKKINPLIIIIPIVIVLLIIIGVLIALNFGSVKKPIKDKSYESLLLKNEDSYYMDEDELKDFEGKLLTSYDDYKKLIDEYNFTELLTKDNFIDYDYLTVLTEQDYCGGNVKGIKVKKIENNKIYLSIEMEATCGPCPVEYYPFLVRFNKNKVNEKFNIDKDYITVNDPDCDPNVAYKPIIYLYPEKETSIKVNLGRPNKLTTTYPKYDNGWEVIAYPNGDLLDNDGKYYYALYWEGFTTLEKNIRDTGFVIKGEDSIKFLEEKLSILGLNDKEKNEFIMYWLPKLEVNNYNYIYFETMDEIEQDMSLNIEPKPDKIIRVRMDYKPLNKYIDVQEQVLIKEERQGFTVVEWGGTIINK